jgi:anti-sigma factor RsiW
MHPDCHAIQERFTDYLDRSLSLSDREGVEAHTAGCAACRNALAMSRELVGVLAEVPGPMLPDGFAVRLAARLAALPEAPRRRPVLPWRRLASAPPQLVMGAWGRALAGVAVGVLLTLVFVGHGTQDGREAATAPPGAAVPAAVPAALHDAVHVPMGADATVRVFFDAARAVDRVTFSIELPDGVRMVSDGQVVDLGRIEWQGSLVAGRNLLTIPVRGVARGEWSLRASIRRGGARREQAIDLLVNGA